MIFNILQVFPFFRFEIDWVILQPKLQDYEHRQYLFTQAIDFIPHYQFDNLAKKHNAD